MKPMRLLSALFLALLALPALAADFEAGRDYHVFDEPRRTTSGDQVEVTEFFAYSCPACRRFNGPLHDWYQQTERDVSLVRVPIPLRPQDQAHVRAYFTAQALGVVDEVHDDIYVALHDQGRALVSQGEVRDFFAERGVSPEAFDEAWDSRAVQTRTRRAMALARDYQVRSTPTVAVDGRYRITGGQAGSQARMIEAIEYLAGEREAARAAE
ncbi:thiol:disulfide interchange protein DsbA/DsbL [Alkalilimnicola ehrlichii MLHE-1]|uniref:Thiol:disulfide interchange protein n=1 Tax=Alkalilimnicola ehrlichii (strain ATCC BAA-1101 / DSM 17681 / MLHE-1) TaxID=187272 RepID=Q0A4P7_ALKEH|nr:thiol:disulfide interchange protein DsbA/DsbL [Alkalilimnicola ehrlichii]ABI58190.1 DSBA oxidoreductase [Alkalilimnicola ehrlichii MLHE-1]